MYFQKLAVPIVRCYRKDKAMQQKLEQFKRTRSLRIFDGMPARWPKMKEAGKLNVKKLIKDAGDTDGVYATENGVIAFISSGELFVAPESAELLTALADAKFERRNFHVPFAHRDLPQGKALKKWEKLVREALHAAETATEATLSPQTAVATA